MGALRRKLVRGKHYVITDITANRCFREMCDTQVFNWWAAKTSQINYFTRLR
jgi:hypothetical protein